MFSFLRERRIESNFFTKKYDAGVATAGRALPYVG